MTQNVGPDQWVRKTAAPAVQGSWAAQPPAQVNQPQIEVRTYSGSNAQGYFQQDAAQMSAAGWFPIAQAVVEGRRSGFILILGIIGLLFFIVPGLVFLVIWAVYHGPSSLTVTYQYRPTP